MQLQTNHTAAMRASSPIHFSPELRIDLSPLTTIPSIKPNREDAEQLKMDDSALQLDAPPIQAGNRKRRVQHIYVGGEDDSSLEGPVAD